MWWRTRATCHNNVTVTSERHPLKSPHFQYLNGNISVRSTKMTKLTPTLAGLDIDTIILLTLAKSFF